MKRSPACPENHALAKRARGDAPRPGQTSGWARASRTLEASFGLLAAALLVAAHTARAEALPGAEMHTAEVHTDGLHTAEVHTDGLHTAQPDANDDSPGLETRTKPRVRILATGGTIAGVADSSASSSYKPGQLSVDVLIAAVPQLEALADVSGEQVVQIASQDMTDAIWLTLARRINALLESPDVDAIVVTHGTDTMEETAYFLHLTVDSDKPVVLTGAMRPSTALGADGPNNLYNAVAVASDSSSRGRGVLVVFNDTIHSARDVTKSNTTRVQTFVSPNRGPLGEVRFGEVRYFRAPASTHTASSDFRGISVSSLPEVMIVYAHANMDGRLIDAAVGGGARGLVVAGTGNGNASKIALKAMARAARAGTVVVRSARVGSGFVARNIEVDDDALGFVAAGDLNPQKARVLLALALAEPRSVEQIQKMFFEY